jgi:hypothetical protein
MAITTRTDGTVITAAMWNEMVDAINRAAPSLQQTVSSLDVNGSIVLTTGEETDLVLDGIGAVDVNGCSVPDRSPWPIYIINVTASTATLKHEDATETTPAKRFLLPGGTDYTLGLGEGILLRYMSVPAGARWASVAK